MRGHQTRVVLKHEQLKFSELAEEIHALGLLERPVFFIALNLIGLECTSASQSTSTNRGRQTFRNDFIDKPRSTLLNRVFIAVDFLLLEGPVVELLRMSPKRNLGWDMDKPELT